MRYSIPLPRVLIPRILIPVAALTLALTACSTPSSTAATTPSDGGALTIVTSTNVWASVASAVGGDLVKVSAVLNDPSADPHSFEATPATKLAMSDASVVLVNGGGYDDWAIDTVQSLDSPPPVINAVDVSGLNSDAQAAQTPAAETPAAETSTDETATGTGNSEEEEHHHGEFNEHVFYDLDSVTKVADALATELGSISPANAATFTKNAADFNAQLTTLKADAVKIGSEHPDTDVIATEPVVGYLLEDMGLHDITPEAFSAAVETGGEVSVKDLADTKDLITSKKAALLFNNTQTSGTVTDELVATAKAGSVPVIGVTETMPAGITDYPTWVKQTIDAVSKDLNK